MNWSQAQERLRTERGYAAVARGTGLHVNSVRNYALGLTRPRIDNAQKIVDWLAAHTLMANTESTQDTANT